MEDAMPVNRLKPFAAALAGASLLAAGMVPAASHAESLQDVFTQEELDTLFGEGAQIPKYIGPHRVVMSLQEAQQIEGEALPKFLIGFYIGGFVGAGVDAATNPNSTKGSRTRSALIWGIGGGVGGAPGGFIAGPIAGGAAQVGCNACHEVK